MSFELTADRWATTWPKRLFIAERYLLSFSMGIFALLPAYLLSIGRDEVFFGSISACGVAAAILIILFSPSLAQRFGIRRLAPVGGLLYAAGCATMIFNELSGARLPIVYFIGYALQSGGWALHFTVGSICISALSDDSDRSFNFMIYAAFSTLGLTCGPLLSSLLSKLADTPLAKMFALAMMTALFGSCLSIIASSLSARVGKADIPKNVPIVRELPKLFTGKTLLFFVLVFLSASIYTTLINFQATFAGASGLSYEVFFACWAMGVVGSRFSIGSKVSRSAADRTLPLLLGGMVVSLLSFLLAPGDAMIYGMASLAIGVTYGLSYPVIQAEAVRVAATHARTVVQIIFSLSYFVGLYFFPLVAGLVSVHLGYDALIWLVASLALLQTVLAILGYSLIRHRSVADHKRGLVEGRTDA
ncbi:MFS transporter [Sinorhizobium numidicum]|uniref:MFS transporter n=1 Tax=Sinorhizobium numidicum TaxID=680248 RepID=A0ABY8CTH1_9HYPH|nr:MFS transporter [Sinorhizobium numidicum]WEX74769.1 MFS transporter [Sinorhizobium numidicum]WEX80762.1 MFS transporter [Sinorhizobium numidicum]